MALTYRTCLIAGDVAGTSSLRFVWLALFFSVGLFACNDGKSFPSTSKEQSREEGWFIQGYRVGSSTYGKRVPPIIDAWIEQRTFYHLFWKRPVDLIQLVLLFDSSKLDVDGFRDHVGEMRLARDSEFLHQAGVANMFIVLDSIPQGDTLVVEMYRHRTKGGEFIDSFPLIIE